jgi:hypothetical protein
VTAAPSDPGDTSGSTAGAGNGKAHGPVLTFDTLGSQGHVAIPLTSVSFDTVWPSPTASAPTLSQLHVVKLADGSSGALFNAATTHSLLGNAEIDVPGASAAEMVRIRLHDVRVVQFQSAEQQGTPTQEQIGLTFDDIFYNDGHYRFPSSSQPSVPSTPSMPSAPSSSAPSSSAPAPTPSGWDLSQG